MSLSPKVLGIITARGGSKSIPRKNVKELGGKPLIAYTVEAAKESEIFDRIILSTDDKEIAEVGKKYGAEIPFMRPEGLAEDSTPTMPVLKHAVTWMKENKNYHPDFVAILQPTAPFRQPRHLKEAFALLKKNNADSVISVAQIPGHSNPMWALRLDDQGLASLLVSGDLVRKRIPRRQDLPTAYTNSGHLYIFKTDLLFAPEPNFYGDKVAAYVVEDKYCINIDGPEDWERAEKAIRLCYKKYIP